MTVNHRPENPSGEPACTELTDGVRARARRSTSTSTSSSTSSTTSSTVVGSRESLDKNNVQPTNHSTAPRVRVSVKDLLAAAAAMPKPEITTAASEPKSQIEAAIGDESIARMAGSFSAISPQLDESWFRSVLRVVGRELPKSTPEQIKTGSRAAFDYCQRRFPIPYGQRGYVAFPRDFAKRVILAEVERASSR